MHSILIPTLEKREQEYVKYFELEGELGDALEDDVNDWDKIEDHKESVTYIAIVATTMKCVKEGDSSKLPSF